MVALAVDIKTAQARAGHRDAKTTLNIYARPTRSGDRDAAERLGRYFLVEETPDRGIARDRRGMEQFSGVPEDHLQRPDQGKGGGASWNRTSDLSIINAMRLAA